MSLVNWEIFGVETSLSKPHEGVCVLGVLLNTVPQKATGQQMARHEARDQAEVWLLRGSAHFGGAEDMAGPAGRSIHMGTPEQKALGDLEMLSFPLLRLTQKASFQGFQRSCTSAVVVSPQWHHLVNFHVF